MAEHTAPRKAKNKEMDKPQEVADFGSEEQLVEALERLNIIEMPGHGAGRKRLYTPCKYPPNSDADNSKQKDDHDEKKSTESMKPDAKSEDDNLKYEGTEISKGSKPASSHNRSEMHDTEQVQLEKPKSQSCSEELKRRIHLSDEQRRKIENIREILNPEPLNAAGEPIDVFDIDELLALEEDGALLQSPSQSHNCTMLTVLNLNGCTRLTEVSVRLVCTYMPRLTGLYLGKCSELQDPSIHNISTCLTLLEKLSIDNCHQISNAGLEFITRIETLKSLQMRWCYNITNIRSITNALNLEGISLSGTLIRKEHRLRPLMDLPKLIVVELYDVPAATPKVIKMLMRYMPQCLVIGGNVE